MLAVGLVTGYLSIRHRDDTEELEQKRFDAMLKPATPRAGSYRHFMRGHTHKPDAADFVVEVAKKPKLRKYDKLLKKFKYHEALDAVFAVRVGVTAVIGNTKRQSLTRLAASSLLRAGQPPARGDGEFSAGAATALGAPAGPARPRRPSA